MPDIQINDLVQYNGGRAYVVEIVAPWKRPEAKVKDIADDFRGYPGKSFVVRPVQKGRPSFRWVPAADVSA